MVTALMMTEPLYSNDLLLGPTFYHVALELCFKLINLGVHIYAISCISCSALSYHPFLVPSLTTSRINDVPTLLYSSLELKEKSRWGSI